jgi:hypothetical protein
LKQPQLIQILRIKGLGAVWTAEFGGGGRALTRPGRWPTTEKAVSGDADTAFQVEKAGKFDLRRFTGR